jgi:hypothetical protein
MIRTHRIRLISIWLACLLWMLACVWAFGGTTNSLFLTWDNSTNYSPTTMFYVAQRPLIAQPPWQPLTNISWTNWTNVNFRLPIPSATDDAMFYVVASSNLFGLTDFSLPVESRRLPRGTGLSIGAF